MPEMATATSAEKSGEKPSILLMSTPEDVFKCWDYFFSSYAKGNMAPFDEEANFFKHEFITNIIGHIFSGQADYLEELEILMSSKIQIWHDIIYRKGYIIDGKHGGELEYMGAFYSLARATISIIGNFLSSNRGRFLVNLAKVTGPEHIYRRQLIKLGYDNDCWFDIAHAIDLSFCDYYNSQAKVGEVEDVIPFCRCQSFGEVLKKIDLSNLPSPLNNADFFCEVLVSLINDGMFQEDGSLTFDGRVIARYLLSVS